MALCSGNIQEGRDGGETSRAVCIVSGLFPTNGGMQS